MEEVDSVIHNIIADSIGDFKTVKELIARNISKAAADNSGHLIGDYTVLSHNSGEILKNTLKVFTIRIMRI
jgi:hypothetical protein